MAIETHIKLFKWAIAGVGSLLLIVASSLGVWIYGQGVDVAQLQRDAVFQNKRIVIHSGHIDKTYEKMGNMKSDISVIKNDVKHTNRTLDKIESILREVHKIKE